MNISVEEVCEKILHGTVMDVFYCIVNNEHIHKKAIAEMFIAHDDNPNSQYSTYRPVIDLAIAKLQGGLLIDTYREKTKDIYYITPYGAEAKKYLKDMFANVDDPTRLHGTIILKKIFEKESQITEEEII